MEIMNWMESLHPESPVREYLRWMNQSGDNPLYKQKYEQIVRGQKERNKIFLTVVVRTQGKRMEMLQDVLTCLQAQSDTDFETVIICHRTSKEACEAVRSLVAVQTPEFAGRTRVIQSDEGERGAPLNLGFAHAKGRYAVCLDDDDLVLEHWVRSFHEAEESHQGMILHAYAVTQEWLAVYDEKTHRQMLSATGSPDPRYCVPYRTLGQQTENSCPFMGLAFPLFLFRDLHVLFNERLTTTEDWDYLLRTAGIAGVSEIEEVTAIYRLWNTEDASRRLIQQTEWKKNYREIRKRMKQNPLLLTEDEAEMCREKLTGRPLAEQKGRNGFGGESVPTEILHPESPVREYLRWMNQGGNDRLYTEKYEQIVCEQKEQDKIFLTVVVRTQGKRMDMLQDVLTCLQSQSDTDFETVIICHRTSKEACEAVRSLVAVQTPEFADRTRVIQSDEGERGAPLNLGFAHAKGRYAVCLDDDDLVLEHWVQSFHEAEEFHQGMILHAYAVTQEWQAVYDEKTHRQILSASSSPDPRYCVPYRTLGQQTENSCPFMGLAFPLFLFRDLHVLFNETLTTTEDWDYLLRTAGIAGVSEIGEVTAIYRLWNTKDASRQLIQEPEWKGNYREISQRMRWVPLLLTANEAAVCREELTGLQFAGQKGRSCFMREAVLFWSSGEPFSDRQHTTTTVAMKDGWIRACFAMKDYLDGKQMTRLRFDPSEETLFALDHFSVRLMKDGNVIEKLTKDDILETNGLIDEDTVLFLSEDPRIVLETQKPESPDEVEVTARVIYKSPEVLARWAEELCADARWFSDNRKTARLFMDYGAGFQEKDCIACFGVLDGMNYQAAFDFSPDEGSGIRQLRFDPTEAGMFWLSELKIQVFYETGDAETLSAEQTEPTTGFLTGNGLAFIDRDPYLMIPIRPESRICRITVSGKMDWVEADRMEDLFAQAEKVPDYELVCGQLERMRQNRRKEEARRSHD